MPETSIPVSALFRKLDELAARYESLQTQLNDPAVLSNPQRVVAVSKESGQLGRVVARYREYQKARASVEELQQLIESNADPEIADLARAELPRRRRQRGGDDGGAEGRVRRRRGQRRRFVLPRDPRRHRRRGGRPLRPRPVRDVPQVLRATAAGGSTCQRLLRPRERGGFKEVIVNVKGDGAYRHLRFEGGGHRVQRVPGDRSRRAASTPAPRRSPSCPNCRT